MIQLGDVLAVHPESQSVDVRLNNGRELTGVRVSSLSASQDSGTNDLPSIDNGNQVSAIIGFISGQFAVCLGFIHPKGNNHGFSDNRALNLHHSGFYATTDANANTEWVHPSGLYMRMGEGSIHDDLTGQDYQEKFEITKNTDKEPVLTIGFVGSALKLVVTPTGINITGGGVAVTSGDVTADGISLKTHVHGNGNGGADTTGPH